MVEAHACSQADRRQKTLFVAFFLSLLLNVFLQLDCVEDYFNSFIEQNQSVAINSPICSTQHLWSSQAPEKGLLGAQALAVGVAPSQTSVAMTGPCPQLITYLLQDQCFSSVNDRRPTPSWLYGSSGLSPPVV